MVHVSAQEASLTRSSPCKNTSPRQPVMSIVEAQHGRVRRSAQILLVVLDTGPQTLWSRMLLLLWERTTDQATGTCRENSALRASASGSKCLCALRRRATCRK